ncbi:DUF885 domain-containing protein [Neolewinella persica]|uniref:DUF885 domain-containing protein n=1 Tax=Neolewinella persica TaxID=70998 RepID=UPI0003A7FCA9|nr:DUF885 domain-containing protein [Neolewinella persica]
MRKIYLICCCSFFLFASLVAQTSSTDSLQLAKVMEEYGAWDPYPHGQPWRTTRGRSIKTEAEDLRSLRARVPASDRLSGTQRINRDLLLHVLDDNIYQREFGAHRFPLDAEGGFLTSVVYRILGQRVNSYESFTHYQEMVKGLGDYFEDQIKVMREGLKAGKTDPRLVVNNCIGQIERQLATPVLESIFLQPVRDDEARTQVLKKVVEQETYAHYRNLRDFLKNEYLPKLRPGIGISEITDGKAYYQQRIRYFTTDDVSPEEVFATGQREVARIRTEMEAIIERTGFEGSFAEFLTFLRTDEQFYPKTPEELLRHAAWITKRMEGKLPQYFNKLPRMPLTVAPVPDALAPTYTTGRYSPGSYQGRKAGAFWVNTYDLPSRPLYVLPALALHEGVPGHHTQMMLAAEMEGLPAFRNNLYLSAFGEGWALYCEYLGKEAGIYETEYEEFGALVYEMWRACRLVVDPGMHYFGWSREKAVDFLSSNTALSLHEVNTEIDRYIGWPGQAVSYKMGELKIRELRLMVEAELGDTFDLPEFHDLVLANGAVTMRGLEDLVEEWIMAKMED